MSENIADYLSKQIFIERNIVTYRSLSRQFEIHVNTAKTELANYHHHGSFSTPDQRSVATFLLSGTARNDARHNESDDEDFDMDGTQDDQGEEDDDGEEVPQTQITIVNERDLEEARAAYIQLDSIHIYSLSPAPIHDAGLLCGVTGFIRSTDKAKSQGFSAMVGRVVTPGIKIGVAKKKVQSPAPIAGSSKLKQLSPESKPVTTNLEAKSKPAVVADKVKEKSKPTGRLEFFSKPKEMAKEAKKEVKEVETVKKEEPEVDSRKKLFFTKAPSKAPSKPLSKAPSPAPSPGPSVASTKDNKRGVKRKSSTGLEPRGKSPVNLVIAKVENASRSKRRVVLSEDESDTVPGKSTSRKSRPSFRTVENNSEAEHEARALMDIDEDEVEKVSRVPSTSASSINEPDDDDGDRDSEMPKDEDVTMEDVVPKKPATKRKPKTIIPVGRNGLKKRKVTKTRRTVDANGYMRKEDYSDWESVDTDAEPEPPAKPKTKPRAKVARVKREEEDEELLPLPYAKEKDASTQEAEPKKGSTAPAPRAKPGAKAVSNPKAQKGKGILNFFGPKKT